MEIYFVDTTTTPTPTTSGKGKFCIRLHLELLVLILKKLKYCAQLILFIINLLLT